MKNMIWNLIYHSETFIFQIVLRMNEVPLWADKVRWFLERHWLREK